MHCRRIFVAIGTRKKLFPSTRNSIVMASFSNSSTISNPFLTEKQWDTPHGIPPFQDITPAHFREALPIALEKNYLEVKSLVDNPEPATFENTIVAFDRAGSLLNRLRRVFSNLCSSCSSDELQAVELEYSGPLAAHDSKIYMCGLFTRVNEIHDARLTLDLNPEQLRLVERIHLDFVRAGTRFDKDAQERYAALSERLAVLETRFNQNIMRDESDHVIFLEEGNLGGLPDFVRQACKSAATDQGRPDAYAVTLSRSLVVPFLTFSDDRILRERAWYFKSSLSLTMITLFLFSGSFYQACLD